MGEQRPLSDKVSLPWELKAFVSQFCDSIALIDVLLLLHKQPDRDWTAEEIRAELRSSLHSVELQLRKIVTMELAATKSGPPQTYRFEASSPTTHAIVTELSRQYSSHRSSIISLIYEKDRDSDINAFTDGFRFRKD